MLDSYRLFDNNESISVYIIQKYELIPVSSCKIELARTNIILQLFRAVILYTAGSCTDVKDRNIDFTLSAGTLSIIFMQKLR